MEAFVTTGSNIKRLDQEQALPVTVFNLSQPETRDSATPMDLLIGIPEITNIPSNESSLNAVAARGDNPAQLPDVPGASARSNSPSVESLHG